MPPPHTHTTTTTTTTMQPQPSCSGHLPKPSAAQALAAAAREGAGTSSSKRQSSPVPSMLKLPPDEQQQRYAKQRSALLTALAPSPETVAAVAKDPVLTSGEYVMFSLAVHDVMQCQDTRSTRPLVSDYMGTHTHTHTLSRSNLCCRL